MNRKRNRKKSVRHQRAGRIKGSGKEKKAKSKPRDFTFEEAEALLNYFNFQKSNKGNHAFYNQ